MSPNFSQRSEWLMPMMLNRPSKTKVIKRKPCKSIQSLTPSHKVWGDCSNQPRNIFLQIKLCLDMHRHLGIHVWKQTVWIVFVSKYLLLVQDSVSPSIAPPKYFRVSDGEGPQIFNGGSWLNVQRGEWKDKVLLLHDRWYARDHYPIPCKLTLETRPLHMDWKDRRGMRAIPRFWTSRTTGSGASKPSYGIKWRTSLSLWKLLNI